jgi:hypothetical protein
MVSMVIRSLYFGPVMIQNIKAEICDGKICSPHGSKEAKTEKKGPGIPIYLSSMCALVIQLLPPKHHP